MKGPIRQHLDQAISANRKLHTAAGRYIDDRSEKHVTALNQAASVAAQAELGLPDGLWRALAFTPVRHFNRAARLLQTLADDVDRGVSR